MTGVPPEAEPRASSLASIASVGALVLLLAAAAIAFACGGGRATGWAVVVTALLAALAATLLGAAALARGDRGPRPMLLALIGALIAWSAVSLVTLPGTLLESLSPRRSLVERAVPRGPDGVGSWVAALEPRGMRLEDLLAEDSVGDAAAGALSVEPRLGPPRPAPASFAPWATRRAVVVLMAFLLLLAALASRPDERLGLALVGGLLAFAAAAAVAGLVLSRTAPRELLGLWEPLPGLQKSPYGAFWNPNHAAAFLAMACPVLLAVALEASCRRGLRFAAALALAPVSLAVVDVGSRGGLLAGGVAALVLGLALLRIPSRRIAGAALVLVAAVGTVLAFTVFAERVIDESFEDTLALEGSNLERRELYAVQAGMLRSSPIVGTGLGAFRTAHGVFRQAPTATLPLHGESDWLETAAEGGLPLLVLWMALVATLLGPPIARIVRGGAPPLLAGLVSGALATLAHALVDFHLREPLVALAAIALAGTAHAWSARLTRRAHADDGGAPSRGRGPALAATLASVAAAGLVAWLSVGEVPRDRVYRQAERSLATGDAEAAVALARRAAEAAPSDGDAWSLLGWAEGLIAERAPPGAARLEGRRRSMTALLRALDCSPATFGAARRCAALLQRAGADAAAVDAVRLAMATSPGDALTRRAAGDALLATGPSPEAVEHFAFTFRAVALTHLKADAPRLTASLLAAAGGDALPGLRAIDEPPRQAWYVTELARLGESAAAEACIAELAARPPEDGADALAGLLVTIPAPATPQLARALLPRLTRPMSRQRAGIALVRAGAHEEGLALVRTGLAGGVDPPEAWLAVADAEIALGRPEAARDALEAGVRRHPGSPALKTRLERMGAR